MTILFSSVFYKNFLAYDSAIDTQEDVKQILHTQQSHEHENLLKWLTPVDYSPQQHDFFSKRQPGTGMWFFNSAEFHTWQASPMQTLYCPGIPGAGKTILTSIVINHFLLKFVKDNDVGIAYIYCNFRRHSVQRLEHLLASLLKQLLQGRAHLPKTMIELYERYQRNGTRPSIEDMLAELQSLASTYSRIFVFIDGLDECQTRDGCRSKFLRNLFDLQRKTGLNILATSREIDEISQWFNDYLLARVRATDQDIEAFIDDQILQLHTGDLSNDVRDMIKREICTKCDGM